MGIWHLGRARRSLGRKKVPFVSSLSRRTTNLRIEPLEERLLFSIAPTLHIDHHQHSQPTARPQHDEHNRAQSSAATTDLQIRRRADDRSDDAGGRNSNRPRQVATGSSATPTTLSVPDRIRGRSRAIEPGRHSLPEHAARRHLPDHGQQRAEEHGGTIAQHGHVGHEFKLDYGAQVSAVVPQPIVRTAQGTLQQMTNQIQVYFTNDTLQSCQRTDGLAVPADLHRRRHRHGHDQRRLTYTPTIGRLQSHHEHGDADVRHEPRSTGQRHRHLPPAHRRQCHERRHAKTCAVTPDQAGSSFGTAMQLGTLTTTTKLITGAADRAGGLLGHQRAESADLPRRADRSGPA